MKCVGVNVPMLCMIESPLAEGRELAWLLVFGKEGQQPRFRPLLPLQKTFRTLLTKPLEQGIIINVADKSDGMTRGRAAW